MARILLFLGVIGFAFYLWNGYEESKPIASPDSPSGFASVMMPSGAQSNTVMIFAPENCPSAEAKRAEALAAQLTELGIPNQRSSRVTFMFTSLSDEEEAAMKRTEAVMNGEIPAVFVNGMAKANPAISEVVAEYQRTR